MNLFDYRIFLKQALELRQAKNPAYTIGAFGRPLGINASRMAQILKGKVGISVKRAHFIAESLNFSEHDKKLFVLLVQAHHERNPEKKKEAIKLLEQMEDGYDDITNIFHFISDWYNHAIRELISIDHSDYNDETIPLKLGISVETYNLAIDRLIKLNFIERIEGTTPTKYKVKHRGLRTRQDVPSEAVKILNEQILDKAKTALRTQDITNRDFSIAIFKFDKNQIELAKEKLQKFRRELIHEFEISEEKNSAYCMSIQFFELTGNDHHAS
jgi:uncharacterized protein (TIGR02147 family)